ncbi:hypothetical protein KJ966_17225 [bacterium]|nr:hypothetical protein [bacterium]
MVTKPIKGKTTKEKVEVYETTAPLLEALYNEIQTLAKKKPEGTLNERKVELINRLLTDIKKLLEDETDSKYLDLIDDENLPQYSDVVLILSQYSASMKKFEGKYFGWEGSDHKWFIA